MTAPNPHQAPQLVFIDGIGGRRFMRRSLLRHFTARGHACHHFEHRPSRESFDAIRARLSEWLARIAASGPYVVIGYSLGGVLARSVLTPSPAFPLPRRLVLVASPMQSLRMCRSVRGWRLFHWLTGDCGQLLASDERMSAVALPGVPITCVYGTQGYAGPFALAGRTTNDGMIAVAETSPQAFDDVVAVHASHPVIATCRAVVEVIEARMSKLSAEEVTRSELLPTT